ncbi:MAG TPA: hypothetical protein V6D22_23005 [Candidatus Obscuribacterales bacterium]
MALTGESALHAAIQDPIDALEQLANHAIVKPLTGDEWPRLQLVADLPKAEYGSADWYAETLGVGLGRTADFLALGAGLDAIGVTSTVASWAGTQFASPITSALAESAARTGLAAGVFGFWLVPADSTRPDFWRQRVVDGAGWALGGAAGGIIGENASSWLGSTAAESSAGTARSLANRGLAAVARGTSGNMVKTGTYALLAGERTTARILSERMIRGVTKSLITAGTASLQPE